jgi:hypothetical protein
MVITSNERGNFMDRTRVLIGTLISSTLLLTATATHAFQSIEININDHKKSKLNISEKYTVNDNDCSASRDSYASGDHIDTYKTLHIYDFLNEHYINAVTGWEDLPGRMFDPVPFDSLSEKQKVRVEKIRDKMPRQCQ